MKNDTRDTHISNSSLLQSARRTLRDSRAGFPSPGIPTSICASHVRERGAPGQVRESTSRKISTDEIPPLLLDTKRTGRTRTRSYSVEKIKYRHNDRIVPIPEDLSAAAGSPGNVLSPGLHLGPVSCPGNVQSITITSVLSASSGRTFSSADCSGCSLVPLPTEAQGRYMSIVVQPGATHESWEI
uniref:Uncharacterized protein n=1 Tax=Branchiostoma floridae TaxID=7739 RepID=C3ZBR0_BRAFL|eukprot:XP_002594286.1 hypothetical protein BRAFLDRAFT_65142 [Branchiostoma floridae]